MKKMLIIQARTKDDMDKVPSSVVAAKSTGLLRFGQ
jgi:hypothetical protein